MSDLLPYHCSTLRANFLNPPCEAQVAAAKEYRKNPFGGMLSYGLAQCLECEGRGLITREALPAAIVKETQQEELMEFQNVVEAPRCPKHPEELQMQCGPESKRAGQYLGACRVCMAERKVGRKPDGQPDGIKEKMTLAVARDMGLIVAPNKKGQGESAMAGVMHFKSEEEAERICGPGKIAAGAPVAVDPPLCERPDCTVPGSMVKIDKLGRSMGMCVSCLSARGHRCGIESHALGKTSPPVSIPLNQAEYAELKAWLEDQAKWYERTLGKEIMFRLKLAMQADIE